MINILQKKYLENIWRRNVHQDLIYNSPSNILGICASFLSFFSKVFWQVHTRLVKSISGFSNLCSKRYLHLGVHPRMEVLYFYIESGSSISTLPSRLPKLYCETSKISLSGYQSFGKLYCVTNSCILFFASVSGDHIKQTKSLSSPMITAWIGRPD